MKHTEDEPAILMCAPVAWADESAQIPGSVQIECDECGQPIYIAPSGRRIVETQGARPVCVPCGQEVMAEEGHIEPKALSDDQKKELKDALLRERL